ncbi:MAG: hypothetical protein M3R53_06595 [Candidatus Eremiobacteraeota bacterium]|nr:hypothetical protein [Candidatus Eremiobacteraeota bacterium]
MPFSSSREVTAMDSKTASNELTPDDPIAPIPEDDILADSVDGEAVVVPGQRPGPTEPTSN